jgi:hypothetical protein
MMSHVENNVLAAKIVVSTSFDAAATALRDRGSHVGKVNRSRLDDRFHETGLDEASIHGTGIMLVDSSFEKS